MQCIAITSLCVYIDHVYNYPHNILFFVAHDKNHRHHQGLPSLWSRHREILELLLRSRPISPAENAPKWRVQGLAGY